MNAPVWLPNLLAVLAIAVAGYSVFRALTALTALTTLSRGRSAEVAEVAAVRAGERKPDYETDVLDAVLALALAAMLVHWMDVLPRAVWIVALNATGYWFAWRLIRLPRASLAHGGGRLAASAAGSAIAVYMLLAGVAPAAAESAANSSAQSHVMAGMAGMAAGSMAARIAAPGLGVLFAVGLAAYAAVALNLASTPVAALDGARAAPVPVPAPAATTGMFTSPVPRSVEICRVLLAVIMAYAILAQLV